MNCVKGDIARIVNNDHGNLDRLVHVDELTTDPRWWLCTALQQISIWVGRNDTGHPQTMPAGTTIFLADVSLRPIRDAGDDAVDEMVRRVPVPRLAVAA